MKNYRRQRTRTWKRRRQVYLKKAALFFATFLIMAGVGIYMENMESGSVVAQEEAAETGIEHKYYKSIEIADGDTLWSIAQEYMSDDYASINEYIDELEQINDLDSKDDIYANRYLTVVYYNTAL